MDIKLFNKEIKEKYLNDRFENEASRNTIRYMFRNSELIEDILNKDLYNFNLTEIGKVIKNANPHSKTVAENYGRVISGYISWAIKPMGLRENNINPLKGVDDSFYDDLVDKTKKVHYSYDELLELVERLPNAQDQATLMLLFEGIHGNNFSELSNIHYNDINWNENTIYIKDREETITVSDACMRFIERAYKQPTYYTYDENTGGYKEKQLVDSPYVFKNKLNAKSKGGEPISHQVFYFRITDIKKEFDLEYLTANALKQSGMIKMAADILKDKIENGKEVTLEYEDFAKIGDKYKLSMINNNGYDYYNTAQMKTYITPEKIEELYGIKMK